MKILLDHNIPRPVRRVMTGHTVVTTRDSGWDRLANGDLLRTAEANGFEVLLTADQGIVYQQNNAERRIALVVLSSNRLPDLLAAKSLIADAVVRSSHGSYEFVAITPID